MAEISPGRFRMGSDDCHGEEGGNHPRRAFSSNGCGLHNMTGDVWEWTSDYDSPTRIGVAGN